MQGGARLAQNPGMWGHCPQETLNESQEIFKNVLPHSIAMHLNGSPIKSKYCNMTGNLSGIRPPSPLFSQPYHRKCSLFFFVGTSIQKWKNQRWSIIQKTTVTFYKSNYQQKILDTGSNQNYSSASYLKVQLKMFSNMTSLLWQ